MCLLGLSAFSANCSALPRGHQAAKGYDGYEGEGHCSPERQLEPLDEAGAVKVQAPPPLLIGEQLQPTGQDRGYLLQEVHA